MDKRFLMVAETCLKGAESDRMSFPEIVENLMRAGFESYFVDFRRATATYYRPDGQSIVLATHHDHRPIAPQLDHLAIQTAIHEAQQARASYTYLGFCAKIMTAGCAGYMVSFSGRRAVYFGRTAETHVEPFPD